MGRGTWLSAALLSPLSAAALESPDMKDLGHMLSQIGKMLYGILNNEYTLYFLTVLFAFILFYVVYATPARRLRFFEGPGGLGLNHFGQLFCVALSGLTCVAVFAFRDNVVKATKSFLIPFGIYGVTLFSLLVFLMVWRGFRDQDFFGLGNFAMGVIGAICAWIFFSYLMGNDNLFGLGILLLGVLLIGLIVRAFYRRHHGANRRTVRRAEHVEEREEQEIARTEADQQRLYAQEFAEIRNMQQRMNQEQQLQRTDINEILRRLEVESQ